MTHPRSTLGLGETFRPGTLLRRGTFGILASGPFLPNPFRPRPLSATDSPISLNPWLRETYMPSIDGPLDVASIVRTFATSVERRLEPLVHLAEAELVAMFTFAAIQHGVDLGSIKREYPHPRLPGKRMDLAIVGSDGRLLAGCEFKRHSRTPSGKNQPVTKAAARVFGDLAAVSSLPADCRKLVLYLTDDEMRKYWRTGLYGINKVFDLPVGESITCDPDVIKADRNEFVEHAKTWLRPMTINSLAKCDWPLLDQHLRVLETVGQSATAL